MKNPSGSYLFDQFTATSQSSEVDRLLRQAQLLAEVDQEIYRGAGLQQGMKVLDVGCGLGVTSAAMVQDAGAGQVLGMDVSEGLLAVGRSLPHGAQVDLRWGDIYELPLPDRSVDFVYARLLFQHLADPLLALAEVRRVLRPSGRVCIVDIAEGWFALDPEPVAFRVFREQLKLVQGNQGGAPLVGSRLGGLLASTGFAGVEMGVKVVTSEQLGGIDRFCGLLSFGSPYDLADGAEGLGELAIAAKAEMMALANLPYAWGAFGLFVAIGNH